MTWSLYIAMDGCVGSLDMFRYLVSIAYVHSSAHMMIAMRLPKGPEIIILLL